MALIKCPECGKEVSDSAKKCPSCGYKLKNVSKVKIIIICVLLVALIIGAVCVGRFLLKDNTTVDSEGDKIETFVEDDLAEESVENQTTENNDKFDRLKVEVTDKVCHPENVQAGQFSDFAELVIEYTNMYDKPISAVQGIIYVDDILDNNLVNVNWSMTDTIQPNTSYVERDKGVEINQFLDNQTKFYNTDFNKLKVRFVVEKIVFEDGEVLE